MLLLKVHTLILRPVEQTGDLPEEYWNKNLKTTA